MGVGNASPLKISHRRATTKGSALVRHGSDEFAEQGRNEMDDVDPVLFDPVRERPRV